MDYSNTVDVGRNAGELNPPDEKALPTHAADGTDLTLVRWMLNLSPDERLEMLESGARSLTS